MNANSSGLFQAVRFRFQPHLLNIKYKHGNTLTDKDLVVNGGKNTAWNLYSPAPADAQQSTSNVYVYEKKPTLLKSEIVTAIKKLSNRKASGPDDISAELYKNGCTAMAEVLPGSLGNC